MSEDSLRELSVERIIHAPVATVWSAWADRKPEWWAPRPWTTMIVAQDLRAGGRSAMIMAGPDGPMPQMEGVFLEVVPHRKVVVTDAYRDGWVPQPPFMTALFEFTDKGDGTTLYRASARHWTDEACEQHKAMGFEQGWAICAAQLAALCEG